MRLVLLPGMDGTGELFAPFLAALLASLTPHVVAYPTNIVMGCDALLEVVSAELPADEPYILLAESFSTPLAVRLAASQPHGLAGLVLVSGFVSSPVTGTQRAMMHAGADIFRLKLPRWAVTRFMLGEGAPRELIEAVLHAVARVEPKVLAERAREIAATNVRREFGSLQVPTLLLQPTEDRLLPAVCRTKCVEGVACTQVAIDGPHLLLQRQPAKCAEAITQWAGKLTL